ncbi:MAG: hypothetical protein JNL93_21295 [Pelomonas sp.]|nr:hypothetical protein [Roseateles sp.]
MRRHHRPHTRHAGHRVLFGIAVIGVGLLVLLDNLRLFDVALMRTFWPLAFVLWGLARLAWPVHRGSGLLGVVLIAVGVMLTAQNLGYVNVHWREWWPVFIIAMGVSIVMRGLLPRATPDAAGGDMTVEHGEQVDIQASFSAVSQRNDSSSFKGGRVTSTFGGVELDLTQATMAGPEARLDISARFSGIELRVPRDWTVAVELAATFGGVEDKTLPPMTPGPRLVLTGEVMFGGVEIKH